MEEDLARPVIMIRDFETGEPAYEIYTFNRQVVTVPLGEGEAPETRESGVEGLASKEIEREIRSIARGDVAVEVRGKNRAVVYVEESDISQIIGKGGGRIADIEDTLGVDIDVRTFEERPGSRSGGSSASRSGGSAAGEIVEPRISDRHVVIPFDDHAGDTVEVEADGEYLFTATVSRGGEIQVSRGSAIAEELEKAIDRSRQITVTPT
jgi:ATPase